MPYAPTQPRPARDVAILGFTSTNIYLDMIEVELSKCGSQFIQLLGGMPAFVLLPLGIVETPCVH